MPSTTLSPVHFFLTHLDSSHQRTAFLSLENAFLPPQPLSPLPSPFNAWSKAAQLLPDVAKSSEWSSFIHNIPLLSAEHLPDLHLLQANICLGAIAHAIAFIAAVPVPDSILRPWKQVNTRLGNTTVSFTPFDLFYHNFDIIPDRLESSAPLRTEFVSDPWSQTRRRVMLTGTLTEAHFLTSVFSIEAAARPLPSLISLAHNAVLNNNNHALQQHIASIIDVIDSMTSAFLSCDCRPMSPRYVDHVEFNRCAGSLALPIFPGEKTASGLLNPSFQLLDAFFSRKSFQSEVGIIAKDDRQCFPKLHRDLFHLVEQVSVFEYINSRNKDTREVLMSVFRRALDAFAGEHGVLGKHRLRINGFMEIGSKVGRPATASGMPTPKWQRRPWVHVNNMLQASMAERLQMCREEFFRGTVESCRSSEENGASSIVIDTRGALLYKPGDRIAVLPENSDALVQETLDVLRISPESTITVTAPIWIAALADRRFDTSVRTSKGGIEIRADMFLRFATLQPLNRDLGSRLAKNMYVINPAIIGFLTEEKACNVPAALSLIEEMTNISPVHLVRHLDSVLHPLLPSTYSLASNMSNTPNSVEIVVGKVRYDAKTMVSFQHGLLPWRRAGMQEEDCPQKPREYLESFLIPSDGEAGERTVVSESNEPSMQEETSPGLQEEDTRSPVGINALRKVCNILAKKGPRYSPSAKAFFRAQVICFNAKHGNNPVQVLSGVSSSFLSSRRPGQEILVKVEPELDFHFPSDPEAPIIMVALGSGLAPFRSYLKELINNRSRDGFSRRKAWLIVGVQSRNHIPYFEEIEEAVCKEKVVDLSIAFSRESVDVDPDMCEEQISFRPGTKKRIAELLEENYGLQEKFSQWIAGGAHIYACGRPELEPLVRKMTASAVKRFAAPVWNISYYDIVYKIDSLAKEVADRMATEKRLHIDAYYSGKPAVMKDVFKPSQVAEHHTTSCGWVIFRGSVYDITEYMAVHPGGPKILLDKCGRDMTFDFDVAHGAGNLRVVSMLEPYKIGSLEKFVKGSDRIKTIMKEWSIPLLYGALEHRSVFMLDVNDFPELKEPASFLEYKSYIMSPAGIASLCKRVWERYEPEMFELLEKYFGDGKLWKMVSSLCNDDEGVPQRVADGNVAVEELRKVRRNWLSKRDLNETLSGVDADIFLKQSTVFFDSIVGLCMNIQRCVEEGLEQSRRGATFKKTCSMMIAKMLRSGLDNMTGCYRLLPGKEQT